MRIVYPEFSNEDQEVLADEDSSDYDDFRLEAARKIRTVRRASRSASRSSPSAQNLNDRRRKSVSRPGKRRRPLTIDLTGAERRGRRRLSHLDPSLSYRSSQPKYEYHSRYFSSITIWTIIISLTMLSILSMQSKRGYLPKSLPEIQNSLYNVAPEWCSKLDWWQKPDWCRKPDWLVQPDWYNRTEWVRKPKWFGKPDASASKPMLSLNAIAMEVIRTEKKAGLDLRHQIYQNWSYPVLIFNSSYVLPVFGAAYVQAVPNYLEDQIWRPIDLYTGPAFDFAKAYMELLNDLKDLTPEIANAMDNFKSQVSKIELSDTESRNRTLFARAKRAVFSKVDALRGMPNHKVNIEIERALNHFVGHTLPMIDRNSHRMRSVRTRTGLLGQRLEGIRKWIMENDNFSQEDKKNIQGNMTVKLAEQADSWGLDKIDTRSETAYLGYIDLVLAKIQETLNVINKAEKTVNRVASLLVRVHVDLERSARPESPSLAYDVKATTFLDSLQKDIQALRTGGLVKTKVEKTRIVTGTQVVM